MSLDITLFNCKGSSGYQVEISVPVWCPLPYIGKTW